MNDALKKEDGRFHAIQAHGSGTLSIATEENLSGSLVSFGLPSGPALFLSLSDKAFRKIERTDVKSLFDTHAQGIWPDNHSCLFNYFEDYSSHIIGPVANSDDFAHNSFID